MTTLNTIRNKLERWELNHLRQHASDLAARLERAEEAAEAEREAAEYWRVTADNMIQEQMAAGETIGITKTGFLGNVKMTFIGGPAVPDLAEGETYVGIIGNADSTPNHIILLPGDNDGADWKTQMDWAKSIGGELPTRVEQALLYANCKPLFKDAAYWSSEQHSSESGWAWYQYFNYGDQSYTRKGHELRARAVRRLPI